MISPQETLGNLATTYPHSTSVFLRHRLDFCCGGRQKLVDACDAAGLSTAEVIAEIEAASATPQPQRWDNKPVNAVIEFIIARYHTALRRDLPPLIEAAKRVERVHAGKPAVPVGLGALLDNMHREIVLHMHKEEEILFPQIRRGNAGPHLQGPVSVMTSDHDRHGDDLKQIRALTGDLLAPAHACATWRALYQGLLTLERELMEHIHLENNIVFPRALA